MNRRGFFATLAGALLARKLPMRPAPVTARIVRKLRLAPEPVGIAIRIVRQYDPRRDRWIERYDVLTGFPAPPSLSCRVLS
jgi:hypothetical protein